MPNSLRRPIVLVAASTLAIGLGAGSQALAAPTTHHYGTRVTNHRTVVPNLSAIRHSTTVSGHFANTALTDSNWAGYEKSILGAGATPTLETPLTQVSGTWVVPKATTKTAGEDEYGADWVGIGGGDDSALQVTGSPFLIQAGTESDIDSTGATTYDAWFEVLPAPELVVTNFTVKPGDTVSVNITQLVPDSDVWDIALTDSTENESYDVSQSLAPLPYPAFMDTAEWIQEAPTVGGTQSAIAELGTTPFTGSVVNNAPAGLSTDSYDFSMADANGNVVDTPSAPDASGQDFDLCTYATSCAAP